MFKHEYHGPMYKILYSNNKEALANYLRNGFRTTLTHGLGLGESTFAALARQTQEDRSRMKFLCVDRLFALAESLGLMPYENPEQGQYGKNIHANPKDIIQNIESYISKNNMNVPIDRPKVMGAFGVMIDGKLIDTKVPEDVYCANLIKKLVKQYKCQSIAEIGGGFGGLAMQALRHGCEKYTVFDLPIIIMVQGYYLMKVFGGDVIKMPGEMVNDRMINLRPYWDFTSQDCQFDLVVNRDSMPEMPLQAALGYIAEIKRRNALFLSINQECEGPSGQEGISQLNVQKLMMNGGWDCIMRYPYWLRKGYTECLYKWSDA